jgi:hypothetical protein
MLCRAPAWAKTKWGSFRSWPDGSRHGGGLHSSPPYKGGLGQILKQKSGAHDRHRELVFRGGNMKSKDLTRSI